MFWCVRPWYIDNHMLISKASTINGFDLSLPVAVCSGLANSWFTANLGELITKYGFSNCLYHKPYTCGLANSLETPKE
jgi:hypothetical protein